MRWTIGLGISLFVFGTSGCSSSDGDGGGDGGSGADGGASGGAGGTGAKACELPKDVGPCDGAFVRWWFDKSTGKCAVFSFGGCEGNANNFETAEACVSSCAPAAVSNPCTAVSCGSISQCVFVGGTKLSCAVPCGEGCAATSPCGCAASCPGCEDCVQVCLPPS